MSTGSNRLQELIEKYGFLGLVGRIVFKPFRMLREWWKRTFQNYCFVFRYDPETPHLPPRPEFSVRSFSRIEDVPEDLLDELKAAFGEERTTNNLIGVKHRGCVMWVGFLDGEAACVRLSRQGSAIPHWFIELQPEDVVFLLGFTAPKHRGKGLSPALNQAMIDSFPTDSVHLYSDCSIHNAANIRSMPKAGFMNIGKYKPIHEDWPTEL